MNWIKAIIEVPLGILSLYILITYGWYILFLGIFVGIPIFILINFILIRKEELDKQDKNGRE